MSRENVERVKRAFAALSKGDFEAALEHIDPSFEVDDRVAPEANPTERGPGALVTNLRTVTDAFGDLDWEAQEIVDLEDRVLVRVRLTARGKHSALPIDEEVGHVYTIENGKAVKLEIFRTWAEAREAAGASG